MKDTIVIDQDANRDRCAKYLFVFEINWARIDILVKCVTLPEFVFVFTHFQYIVLFLKIFIHSNSTDIKMFQMWQDRVRGETRHPSCICICIFP